MLGILTRRLSCCFLHEEVEPIVDVGDLVLHVLRTLSAVPSEVLRQIVVHLDRKDAPIFLTILETAVDRAPPYEELAGITFHFLSVVGTVLCVNKDAWLGVIPRESAPVSLMPA